MHIFANTRVAITPHEEAPVVDPVAPVLLALAAILAGAKLGGDLAERIGQPAVLGELVVGILLGNLDLVGVSWFRGWPPTTPSTGWPGSASCCCCSRSASNPPWATC